MIKSPIIYALIDPISDQIRYVGKSVRGMIRIEEHINDCFLKRDQSLKGEWLRNLKLQGLRFGIRILAQPEKEQLNKAERFWIALGRRCGWPLLNATDGGEGLLNCHPSTRAKISKALTGRPVSEETRRKISLAQRGRAYPAMVQRNIARTGFRHSEATKIAISKASRTMIRTREHCEKISNALKGRIISAQTREKIGATFKGKPWSFARRAAQEKRNANV